ncbi:MAG: antitoxin VapB family protein [Candidatus Thorarchaeota archaeon]|nr:antitoxin VapB family protein [Candidatus Thorarchaeota archaeon]
MGYKTITLSEDAYELLKNEKKASESFSPVIIRLTSRRSLDAFVGCISNESVEKLSSAMDTFWKEEEAAWSIFDTE